MSDHLGKSLLTGEELQRHLRRHHRVWFPGRGLPMPSGDSGRQEQHLPQITSLEACSCKGDLDATQG